MKNRLIAIVVLGGFLALVWWLFAAREKVARPEDSPAGVGVAATSTPEAGPAATPGQLTAKPVAVATPRSQTAPVKVLPATTAGKGTEPAASATVPGGTPGTPGAVATVPPMAGTEPASEKRVFDPEVIATDVGAVTFSLRDYRTVMGENPTGTNAEITEALNGKNRRGSRLLPENATLNGNGELVDRYGTPYFFHQLSASDMEVRSAGEDRVLWTDDDVVSH